MAKSLMAQVRAGNPDVVQDVTAERVTSLEVRAELRIRNNTMITARKALGLSQKKLSEAAGVPFNEVQAIEKFDFRNKRTSQHARTLANFLDLPPETLFPEELKGQALPSTLVVTGSFEAERLLEMKDRFTDRFMLPAPDETNNALEIQETRELLKHATLVLRPRELMAVKMYFGLDDQFEPDKEYTLKEIGDRFSVSRARAEQLVKGAIRRLQHPNLIRQMMWQLGEDPDNPMHICKTRRTPQTRRRRKTPPPMLTQPAETEGEDS